MHFLSIVIIFFPVVLFEPYKCRDPAEEKVAEQFLEQEGIEETKAMKILDIIKQMGMLIFCCNLEYTR